MSATTLSSPPCKKTRNIKPVDYKEEPSDLDGSTQEEPTRKPVKSYDHEFVAPSGSESGSSEGSSSDQEDKSAPWEEISDYEKMVMKNIEARNKFMAEMGFPEAIRDLKACVAPIKPKKPEKQIKRVVKPRVSLPLREPSRRIRNLAAKLENQVKEEVKTELQQPEINVDDRILDTSEMNEEMTVALNNINGGAEFDPNLNLAECSISQYRDQLLSLKLLRVEKALPGRIQSMHIHPSLAKLIIFTGDKYGNFGVWDPRQLDEKDAKHFPVHRAAVSCISVSREDPLKVYTTGHDGAVIQIDFNQGKFINVFATDYADTVSHLTWHDEFENQRFLVAHGRGDVGILDLRAGKEIQKWIDCFPRSAKTVQHHPIQTNYFIVSSGTGGFKIFDIRNSSTSVCFKEHGKSVSSAFFSSKGSKVVSTCLDDRLRVFDSSVLSNLPSVAFYHHNNFTGRWLTPFRANWVPNRDDVFHVGSLLQPKRIQFYKADNGGILMNKEDPDMTTISSVIALHPTMPVFTGGNSSGKVYLFGPLDFIPQTSTSNSPDEE